MNDPVPILDVVPDDLAAEAERVARVNLAESDALDWIAAQDRHADRRESTLSMMEAAAGRRLGDRDYRPPLILGERKPDIVPLASIPTDPPPPLLIDRLDPEGHTILYGTGGIGKGALACSWIARLVAEGRAS